MIELFGPVANVCSFVTSLSPLSSTTRIIIKKYNKLGKVKQAKWHSKKDIRANTNGFVGPV